MDVDTAFRDYEVDGVPSSGPHNPVKSEIREALNTLVDEVNAAGEAAVDDITELLATANVSLSSTSVVPYVFDMHWRALRGVGWDDAEAGGAGTYVGFAGTTNSIMAYQVATNAAAGDTSLTLTGNMPVDNQLIVVKGGDGEYYTVSVNGTPSGGVVNLNSALPVAVGAGQNAWAFWINNTHPNKYGYQAIADELARKSLISEREVRQLWTPFAVNTGAVSENTADDTFNPGATGAPGYTITPTSAGDGCEWIFQLDTAGQYRAVFHLNSHDAGDMLVRVTFASTAVYQKTLDVINDGYPQEIFFEATDQGTYTVRVTRNVGTTAFDVSYCSIREILGPRLNSFATGKHVFVGDSWFAISTDDGVSGDFGIIDRLRERFPNATWVNAGVGGYTSASVAGIIDSVLAANPDADYVHIMCSTNDIVGARAVGTFSREIGLVRSRCISRGAIPIMYTGYVGSATRSTANFRLSRQYARDVSYYEYKRRMRRYPVSAYVVNATTAGLISLGQRNKPFIIGDHYLSQNVAVKEGSSQPAGSDPAGGAVSISSGLATTRTTVTPTPNKFVQIVCTNGGGSPFRVDGYIDIQDD